MKQKCKCGKLAVWLYAPSDSNVAYCDNCVPRGCSCNNWEVDEDTQPIGIEGIDWKWIVINERFSDLDNRKNIPCCEYLYDENGFEFYDD